MSLHHLCGFYMCRRSLGICIQTETWVCISVFLLTVTITSPFGYLYLMLIKRPQLLITQPVAVLPLRLHFSLNVRGSIISITAQNRILYVLM